MESQATPKSQGQDESEMLGGAVVAIIGIVFLIFQIPHIVEVYRIRNGTTAVAVVTELEARRNTFLDGKSSSSSTRGRRSDSPGRYYIKTAFSFVHNGVEYHGNRFTVFEEIYGRRDMAVNATSAATATNGNATVYFDPDDPSSAVLDTRVTFLGLRFLLLGSALVSMGGLMLYGRQRPHLRQETPHLRIRPFRGGLTAASIRGGIAKALSRSAKWQTIAWTFNLGHEYTFFEISSHALWIYPLVPPVFMFGVPFLIYRYSNRNSLSIDLDDEAGVLRVFKSGLLVRTRQAELSYSSILDVDTVESVSVRRSSPGLALHTLVLFLKVDAHDKEMRLDGFEAPFFSCETVRAFLRARCCDRHPS